MPSSAVSIKQKTTWIIFLVSMTVLLLSFAFFGLLQFRYVQEEMQSDLKSLAEIVSANSRYALAIRDFATAEKVLDSLVEAPEIVSGYLFEPSGQIIAAYFHLAENGERVNVLEDLELIRSEEKQIDEGLRRGAISLWQNNQQLSIFLPINYAGSHVGSLYLHSTMSKWNLQMLYFVFGGLIIFGAAVVLSFLLSVRLQVFVTKPLDQLVEQMREVATKNKLKGFAAQAPLDEYGLLFQGFEEMLNALNVRDELLESHRKNLELKVKERTMALEKAKRDAEEATEAKTQFLAKMSHEIRTPMIGILGMSELLRSSDLTEKDRHLAEIIHESGEVLLNILNDILDISKIEAGRVELTLSSFDLVKAIDESVNLMLATAKKKGLQLFYEVATDVHPTVVGDLGRIRQIISNLISNSLKFTDQGYVKVSLSQGGEVNQGEIICRIDIEDTGTGISPEELSEIFEPFKQGKGSHLNPKGGTGLGLAIARDLSMLMGGALSVRSQPGSGSIFTVKLPLRKAEGQKTSQLAGPDAAENSKDQQLELPAAIHGCRVLLVEDNTTTQELMKILLEGVGLELTVLGNGFEAIDFLAQSKVDLIFMDCQMPEMNGFDTTRQIRALGIETPIVALTAFARSDDQLMCLESGMDDYLSKPFRQKELKKILTKWLGRNSSKPQQADGNFSGGFPTK